MIYSIQQEVEVKRLVIVFAIVILVAGTTTELANIDANAGSTYAYNYSYSAGTYIDICVYKQGYVPYTQRNILLTDSDAPFKITQVVDRNFVV